MKTHILFFFCVKGGEKGHGKTRPDVQGRRRAERKPAARHGLGGRCGFCRACP